MVIGNPICKTAMATKDTQQPSNADKEKRIEIREKRSRENKNYKSDGNSIIGTHMRAQ